MTTNDMKGMKELFADYPELAENLKSRGDWGNEPLLLEAYQAIYRLMKKTKTLAKENIDYLQDKYKVQTGQTHISIRRCINCLTEFLEFDSKNPDGRKAYVDQIFSSQKHRELVWTLKYQCPNDFKRALSGTNNTSDIVKGEKKKMVTTAPVKKTARKLIPTDMMERLAKECPQLQQWMEKNYFVELFNMVISKWNAGNGISEVIRKDIAQFVNTTANGGSITHVEIEYIISMLHILYAYLDMDSAKREERLASFADTPLYLLLKVIKRLQDGEEIEVRSGTFLHNITVLAERIRANANSHDNEPAAPSEDKVQETESDSQSGSFNLDEIEAGAMDLAINEIDRLTAECTRLQGLLVKKDEEHAAYQKERATLLDSNVCLGEKCESLERDNVTLNTKNKTLETKFGTLSKLLASLQAAKNAGS